LHDPLLELPHHFHLKPTIALQLLRKLHLKALIAFKPFRLGLPYFGKLSSHRSEASSLLGQPITDMFKLTSTLQCLLSITVELLLSGEKASLIVILCRGGGLLLNATSVAFPEVSSAESKSGCRGVPAVI